MNLVIYFQSNEPGTTKHAQFYTFPKTGISCSESFVHKVSFLTNEPKHYTLTQSILVFDPMVQRCFVKRIMIIKTTAIIPFKTFSIRFSEKIHSVWFLLRLYMWGHLLQDVWSLKAWMVPVCRRKWKNGLFVCF